MMFGTALADDRDIENFRPATFEAGDQSIIKQIKFSTDSKNDAIYQVVCWIEVNKRGETRPKSSFCNAADKNSFVFLSRVRESLNAAKFVPAKLRNENVNVLMPVTLIHACKDNECKTFGMPNHSMYRDKYGFIYFAPQLLVDLDSDKINKRFYLEKKTVQAVSQRAGPYASLSPGGGTGGSNRLLGLQNSADQKLLGFFSADISEDGSVLRVKTEKKYNSKRTKISKFKKNLKEAIFIPGVANGKLVKLKTNMPYWEVN